MELDDFKKYWNNIQDKEIEEQKYTTEKLDHIIMNTTNTLSELLNKSIYWNKLGKAICSMLIGALLFNLVIFYFIPRKSNTFLESLLYVAILIAYALITMWVGNKQQQIFSIYNGENLKDSLTKTLSAYKRYYIIFYLIYIVVFPAYFYAMIKLFFTYWALSTNTILIICSGGTLLALIGSHLYYRAKFAKKIKSLEINLKELED